MVGTPMSSFSCMASSFSSSISMCYFYPFGRVLTMISLVSAVSCYPLLYVYVSSYSSATSYLSLALSGNSLITLSSFLSLPDDDEELLLLLDSELDESKDERLKLDC